MSKKFLNLNKYAKILHCLSITFNRNFGFQIPLRLKSLDMYNFFFFEGGGGNLVFEIYMYPCITVIK